MNKRLLYGGAFVVGMLVPGYLFGYLGVMFVLFFVGSEYFQNKTRARWQQEDDHGDPIIVLTSADLWIMEITRVFALVLFGCALRFTVTLMLYG